MQIGNNVKRSDLVLQVRVGAGKGKRVYEGSLEDFQSELVEFLRESCGVSIEDDIKSHSVDSFLDFYRAGRIKYNWGELRVSEVVYGRKSLGFDYFESLGRPNFLPGDKPR